MIREIKYFFYLISIFLFMFLILKYYFSNSYQKKSYRETLKFKNNLNSELHIIPTIKNDTSYIIEYKYNFEEIMNQKQRKFWELIE